MNTQNILNANILDILFDGRNKAYGAYDLRKHYNKRLAKALAGTLAICLLFTIGSIFANSKKSDKPLVYINDVDLTTIKDDKKDKPEIPKEQPKPEPQKQVQQAKVTIPAITPDKDFKEEDAVKSVDDLENVKIGSADVTGEKGDDIVGPPAVETSVIGGNGKLTAEPDNFDGTFITAEVPAQFPGGFEAWKKYLERNLNAGLPAENGAQAGKYTVMVTFVVDKEGNISDVKAENAPGFGTEAEAIKIIKKGPKWLPAIQNGRKVAYRARQQVTFMVDDNG